MLVVPSDLQRSAALSRNVLTGALDRDWSLPAHGLEWTCRRTLDHMVDTMVLYTAHLALRATERLPIMRDGDRTSSTPDLLRLLEAGAAMLAGVAQATPSAVRAFHPAGMGDPSGFLAMGCEELLVHTWDISEAFGLAFQPPDDLCRRIAQRIFPWAPSAVSGWDALRWGAGRIALPLHDQLGTDWWYHPAPLEEWDGTINRRTSPPAWR